MQVALGCDHAGYSMKEEIKSFLEEEGVSLVDVGTWSQESCHYPEFAEKVARWVSEDGERFGVLICGTGIGMSIAANKVPGVRAALCHEPYSAQMAREHNDANVLCLGARVIGTDLARAVTKTFVSSRFSRGKRHILRLDLIHQLEISCPNLEGRPDA